MNSAELRIPKPFGEVLAALFATAFVLFFVVLGAANILKGDAIIASSLWLLFIGFILFAGFKEAGIRPVVLSLLRVLARKQFVRIVSNEPQPSHLRFGFRLFGLSFFYRSIPLEKLESVHWSTGQATHMAKRDMNDWSVALWFDHDDAERSQRQKSWRKPDQEIEIVGSCARKEVTAAFGHAFVDFLRTAGAQLIETEDPCRFSRPSSDAVIQVVT